MAGIVPAGADPAAVEATYIANLRYAAGKLAAHGITLLIEAINTRDMPGFYLNTQAQSYAVCAAVNAPNIRMQMDLYHMQIMEGDLTMKLRKYAPHCGHIQVASVPDRHEPDGGEVDYAYLFGVLEELGYDGWIGCEYRPAAKTVDGLGWFRASHALTVPVGQALPPAKRNCLTAFPGSGNFLAASSSTSTQSLFSPLEGGLNSRVAVFGIVRSLPHACPWIVPPGPDGLSRHGVQANLDRAAGGAVDKRVAPIRGAGRLDAVGGSHGVAHQHGLIRDADQHRPGFDQPPHVLHLRRARKLHGLLPGQSRHPAGLLHPGRPELVDLAAAVGESRRPGENAQVPVTPDIPGSQSLDTGPACFSPSVMFSYPDSASITGFAGFN